MATITLRAVKGSPLTNTEVDDNFTNLNNDKYESGSDVSFGDMTLTGESTFSTAAAVTAAGTTQGDATALTNSYNIVTTATTDQGVVLPDAATGKSAKVINATSVNIKVYPASSEAIDSLGTNVAKNLAPGASLDLVCASGSLWKSLLPVVVFDSSGTQLN
jgi:hypothetical protein